MADPLLVGAAMQAGGSILSSAFNFWSQERTNKLNVKLANTAHQREMADLRKAGLNPILTATGGKGAPLPSLAAAKSDNPLSDAGATVASAGRLALDRKLVAAQLRQIDADTYVKLASVDEMASRIRANDAAAAASRANAGLTTAKTPYEDAWGKAAQVIINTAVRLFGPDVAKLSVQEMLDRLASRGTPEQVLGESAGELFRGSLPFKSWQQFKQFFAPADVPAPSMVPSHHGGAHNSLRFIQQGHGKIDTRTGRSTR